MTGATITTAFEGGRWAAGLAKLGRVKSRRTELLGIIGKGLVKITQDRFWDQQDPQGVGWRSLSPAYAAIKQGAGILRSTNALSGGITFRTNAAASEVAVGSLMEYAAVHQFGATIVPKTPGGRLAFRTADGLVFAKAVTIPARPYLGFGPKDAQEAMDALETFVALG